jgi:hypothetical protein
MVKNDSVKCKNQPAEWRQIPINLTPEQYLRLRDEAFGRKIAMAEIVRRLVADHQAIKYQPQK